MKLLRGVLPILTFLIGLVTLAGGLYSMAVTWAIAAKSQQPISLSALGGGLIACAIGILFMVISGAIDPEGGPVRRYRDRPRKPRAHA
jgi:hypothetical protein